MDIIGTPTIYDEYGLYSSKRMPYVFVEGNTAFTQHTTIATYSTSSYSSTTSTTVAPNEPGTKCKACANGATDRKWT